MVAVFFLSRVLIECLPTTCDWHFLSPHLREVILVTGTRDPHLSSCPVIWIEDPIQLLFFDPDWLHSGTEAPAFGLFG